jgi:hypothetical protein
MTSPLEIERGKLIFCGGGFHHHVHAAAVLVEQNLAISERIKRPIAANADIFTGNKFTAALADDDATGTDDRAAKFFNAETFADAIAAVSYATLTFFMCHKIRELN